MIHILYGGDVHSGQSIEAVDVKRVNVYRVKTRAGRYFHVLADSDEALAKWIKEQDAAVGLSDERDQRALPPREPAGKGR